MIPIIEEKTGRIYQISKYVDYPKITNSKSKLIQKSLDDNLRNHYFKALQETHNNLFPKITDNEWLEIFPEAKKILRAQIKEWEEVIIQSRPKIKMAVEIIKRKYKPENLWFWQDVLKYTFAPVNDFATANWNIKRLKPLLTKKGRKGKIKWETALASAREKDLVVVAELYGLKLRKTGKTYQALCPSHSEKTASFHVYPPSRFCCFGCGIKGDVIAFIQMMDKCSFKEAINKLQNI